MNKNTNPFRSDDERELEEFHWGEPKSEDHSKYQDDEE